MEGGDVNKECGSVYQQSFHQEQDIAPPDTFPTDSLTQEESKYLFSPFRVDIAAYVGPPVTKEIFDRLVEWDLD